MNIEHRTSNIEHRSRQFTRSLYGVLRRAVDGEGRRVDELGRVVDVRGWNVDKIGRRVDVQGLPVDGAGLHVDVLSRNVDAQRHFVDVSCCFVEDPWVRYALEPRFSDEERRFLYRTCPISR